MFSLIKLKMISNCSVSILISIKNFILHMFVITKIQLSDISLLGRFDLYLSGTMGEKWKSVPEESSNQSQIGNETHLQMSESHVPKFLYSVENPVLLLHKSSFYFYEGFFWDWTKVNGFHFSPVIKSRDSIYKYPVLVCGSSYRLMTEKLSVTFFRLGTDDWNKFSTHMEKHTDFVWLKRLSQKPG